MELSPTDACEFQLTILPNIHLHLLNFIRILLKSLYTRSSPLPRFHIFRKSLHGRFW